MEVQEPEPYQFGQMGPGRPGRRVVSFRVSAQLIAVQLEMPAGSVIVGAAWDAEHRSIALLAESPDLPEVPENGVAPEVTPLLTKVPSKTTWNWNLPRGSGANG